jgi:hypothetical protein
VQSEGPLVCVSVTRSPLPVPRHIWKMRLHEQRDQPPPAGGESKRGQKSKQTFMTTNPKAHKFMSNEFGA